MVVPQTQSPSTFAEVPSVIAQATPSRKQMHKAQLLQKPFGDASLFSINN